MRRRALLAGTALAVLATPRPALAHGIGGRADLPVPLEFFLYGAGLVLVLTFGALGVLWPKAKLQDGPLHRPLPTVRLGPLWGALRVLGVGFLVLVVVAGLFGGEGVTGNIAPVTVYVLFWLVVPFASAVVGDLWTPLNPWRTLSRALGVGSHRRGAAFLSRFGVWPATIAFVGWSWSTQIRVGPAPSPWQPSPTPPTRASWSPDWAGSRGCRWARRSPPTTGW